jgi:hypothetical protein
MRIKFLLQIVYLEALSIKCNNNSNNNNNNTCKLYEGVLISP